MSFHWTIVDSLYHMSSCSVPPYTVDCDSFDHIHEYSPYTRQYLLLIYYRQSDRENYNTFYNYMKCHTVYYTLYSRAYRQAIPSTIQTENLIIQKTKKLL